VSETDRESGWSEQYAETGGWPPPTAEQRRYGPGTPSPADAESRSTPADPGPGPGPGPTGYGAAGRYGQPADQAETGGDGGYGPGARYGQPGDTAETDGYGAAQYGQPGDRTGTAGYGGSGAAGRPRPGGAAEAGGYGSAGQWGEPGRSGASEQAASSWAPGDSAYGRLTGGNPRPAPTPQQRPRRPWDGRPAPVRRPGGTPIVTYALIGICLVVYLLQQADPGFTGRYGLIPFDVEQGQYARLITAAFLHAGLLHLATNMITLYIVGTPLERVLRPARYLTVYLLSALGGSLLSVWLSPEFSVGVGASGAIFGLFGALVVLRRQVGAEAGGLAVLIGLNLVISFTVPNISWQAHIGGLVTGALVALAMAGVDRLNRRPAG
jgi:membrane associated rhomboid family serine protease